MVRDRSRALSFPYIQPNAPSFRFWLVYDIDRPQAAVAWEDAGLPPPTFTVARKDRDDSAHLWYGLHVPVRMADPEDRSRSMRYAAAVELGMTRALEADAAYGGHMAKTPDHGAWRTLRGPGLYDLGDLAEHLPELPRLPTKGEAIRTGIGRNVELFDSLRHWAYRHARDFKHGSFEPWATAVLDRGVMLNASCFSTPLPFPEVRHTAKSISTWVWKRQRALDAAFSGTQRARGKIRGQQKAVESAALTASILEG